MNVLHILRPEEVVDLDSFAVYCSQQLGTPPTTKVKDMIVYRKQMNRFLEANPQMSLRLLVRVVGWAKAKKKRPAYAHTVTCYVPWAFADGALPELQEAALDEDTEQAIEAALAVETDERARRMLDLAVGPMRRVALDNWRSTYALSVIDPKHPIFGVRA